MTDGVKVYYFSISKPRRYETSYKMLFHILRNGLDNFDIVHIHSLYHFPTFVGSCFARKYKKPYIIAPRGSLIQDLVEKKGKTKKNFYINLIEKRNLEKAEGIHCLTNYEMEEIRKFGFNIKNYFLIPNGIDPNEFNELPSKNILFEKYPQLKGKKIILFFGRISWEKGIDDLIPAFAEVVKFRKDSHLLLVGPDNENYMHKINRWIDEYSIKDFVSWTGIATGKEKLMFLRDSKVFVLPSYSENFGLAVLEAMYMGLPVVITENVGVKDYVTKTGAGFVINKDKKEITNAILHLLNNGNMCKYMGMKGREFVEKNLTWNSIAEQAIKVYEHILKTRVKKIG